MTETFNAVELVEKYRAELNAWDATTIRCGIIGRSGVGKSSLINAIAGSRIAAVGINETTNQPQEFVHRKLTFVDLPGAGTPNFPTSNYDRLIEMPTFDCFMIVFADRVFEDDLKILELVKSKYGKPCKLVRNKIDLAVEDNQRENGTEEEETLRVARSALATKSKVADKVYLVSARYPSRYELSELLGDLEDELPGFKRERLLADTAALDKGRIKKKRQAAEKIVGLHARLAAANGLNPIPGLDVGLDLTVLLKMIHQLLAVYQIDSTGQRMIERIMSPKVYETALTLSGQVVSKYGTTHAILWLLKSYGKNVAVKQAAKWVPFVGSIAAAAVSYRLTFHLGERVIDDCEDAAMKIVDLALQDAVS